jgi:tetratricopeptide (TPR) repeat protein
VQDDITQSIASALRVALGDRQAKAAQERPIGARAEAYDLTLLARHQAARFDETGMRAALATYTRAIALDSTYALPWAGTALVWLNMADDFIAPAEGYARAEQAVQRALSLDSTLADAYSVEAWIQAAYRANLPRAITAAQQALRFNPGDADALEILGLALSFGGNTDSSLAVFRAARAADPLNPQLASDEARALLYAGRYDAAIAAARNALAIDPQYGLALLHRPDAADGGQAGRGAGVVPTRGECARPRAWRPRRGLRSTWASA